MASDLGPFGLKSTLTVTAAVSVCIVFISTPCVFIAVLHFIKSFVHRRSFYVLLLKKNYCFVSKNQKKITGSVLEGEQSRTQRVGLKRQVEGKRWNKILEQTEGDKEIPPFL